MGYQHRRLRSESRALTNTDKPFERRRIPNGVCDEHGLIGAIERGDDTVGILDLASGQVIDTIPALNHVLMMGASSLCSAGRRAGTRQMFCR